MRGAFEAAEPVTPAEGLAPPDPAPDGPDAEGGGAPPAGEDTPPPPEAEGALLPLNDTGNGRRLALYEGEDLIFVPRVGWFIWNGRAWAKDPDAIGVRRLAQGIQTRLLAEVEHVRLEDWELKKLAAEAGLQRTLQVLEAEPEPTAEQIAEREAARGELRRIGAIKTRRAKLRQDHRSFAKTTGNKGRIDALLTESQVELARALEALDADPLMVNVANCALAFTRVTGEGMSPTASMAPTPHARELLLTKMCPVDHDPDATCPRFDAFLARVQPKREMRAFLQRWFGLSLTGLTGEQKFAFLYGAGANGKSVLVDVMARLLGDYAATAKIESLTGKNRRGGSDATPDLVPLVGARMVRASEPDEGERLQEGLIKELTGGEPIQVRALHTDFVEVRPIFKLTISGNHKPDIRGSDDGIWRRVLLVPFDVQIPKDQRDEALAAKLWEERSGILNWLIAGLLDYLEGGLQEPPEVIEATAEYRSESDPIGTFLGECCIVTGAPEDWMTARELVNAFGFWRDESGESRWGERTVSNRLKGKADQWRDPDTGKTFTRAKSGVVGYRGLVFTPAFGDRLRDAPRDGAGRPIVGTSRSG